MRLTIKDFMLSERRCFQLLKYSKWKDGKVRCVYCNSSNIVSNGTRQKYFHKYICRDCNKNFTEKSDTIFSNSFMELREWFYIARELQRGISINQISKELGRKYDHVMHAAHKIMDSIYMRRLIKLSADDIEIDEIYQSVGSKGTKQTKREPRKRGLKLKGRGTYDKDKPPIVAVVERGGDVVMEVFHKLNKKNIDAFLYLVTGRFFHTDDFRIYKHLENKFDVIHESVNHSKKQYAIGDIHTNGIDGIFQDLRHWLNSFKGVCKKNLKFFVGLFEFNFNNRFLKPMNKFILLIERISVI